MIKKMPMVILMKKVCFNIILLLIILSLPAVCFSDYKKPPIPKSFKYIEGAWNTGFVIEDAFGNQWVWVPVGGIDGGFVRRDWPDQGSSVAETTENVPEIIKTGINEHGGFYIARFQASNENGKIASKADKNVWNRIDWSTAKDLCQNMGKDYRYKGADTHMTYDTEWDCVVKWFKQTGLNMNGTNASNSGNVIKTGIFHSNNIYDVAGNMYEWSMGRKCADEVILRGGSFNNGSVLYPVTIRNAGIDPSVEWDGIGFRPAFSLMSITAIYDSAKKYLRKKSDYMKAIRMYETILDIDPVNDDAYNNIISLYKKLQNYDMVLQCSQDAIKINPKNKQAYCTLADAYIAKKDYDQAIDLGMKAIEIDRRYSPALLVLSKAYQRKGNYSKYTSIMRKLRG